MDDELVNFVFYMTPNVVVLIFSYARFWPKYNFNSSFYSFYQSMFYER